MARWRRDNSFSRFSAAARGVHCKRNVGKEKFLVFNLLVIKFKTIKSNVKIDAFLKSVKLTLPFIHLKIFIWKLFVDKFSPSLPMCELISHFPLWDLHAF